jgi:hypothetical protein
VIEWPISANQRSDFSTSVGGGETEYAGIAGGGAGGSLPCPHDHQPGDLVHHHGVMVRGRKKVLAGQGEDLGVAQGDDSAGMGGSRDHRHFAGRFAWPDHPDELTFLSLFLAKGAELAGLDQIDFIGRVTGVEQGRAARQRKPSGVAGQALPLEEAR